LKRLLLTLGITCLSVLFISSFAFAGFERSLHNKLDVNSPSAQGIEIGIVGDYSQWEDADAFVIDLYGKYGIMDAWEVGLDVPLISVSPDVGDDESGIGDVNVWTKYQFIDESKDGFGLAAGLNVKLATGSDDKGIGTGHVDWMPFIMASMKPADQFVLGAKIGFNFVGEPDGANLDDEFHYTIWGGYAIDERLGIVAELIGNTARVDGADDPLELDAGVTYGLAENLGLVAGIGAGLSDASPDWRIFVGLKGNIALMQ
jgi:hypothetical protein